MDKILRIYSEKKEPFDIEARGLCSDLRENLGIRNLSRVRILNRYDIQGISEKDYRRTRSIIFSEPPVDHFYEEEVPAPDPGRSLTIEYLPGQYDQRADSAAQALQIITLGEKPLVATAKRYLLEGPLTEPEYRMIQNYLINPVDSREAPSQKPRTLHRPYESPRPVPVVEGFGAFASRRLREFKDQQGLAMNLDDMAFCRDYFKSKEQRDPTLAEIKILDTYWSDHCRHTTFSTIIKSIHIADGPLNLPVNRALLHFRQCEKNLFSKSRPLTLMNIATMSMKEMRQKGRLDDLEISGEVNACSIIRDITVDGKAEDWLIMFKNETHNHPTEIEPFGGAATCLGGAIRDPLSGRAYVYQAMRVTGSGDPRQPIEQTLRGKLPQKKITVEAAQGYSSYGNQIGLATGLVSEIYHPGYRAKRMEVGAVVGAVKKEQVRREEPVTGDVVLLVGGKTGRDGIGGATGSSKEHTEASIATAGAEVQKGNPVEERKLQRLFRDPRAARMIKKSNDFGAGGVSVAVGELAPGLDIHLDEIPKKYQGLNGTELALSESQERMAVVIDPKDQEEFLRLAGEENLLAVPIARVTEGQRLRMWHGGKLILDISRDFLDTHGVTREASAEVSRIDPEQNFFRQGLAPFGLNFGERLIRTLEDLNVCSQYGLVERFDSTIGKGSVFMPFGGKYQASPMQSMVAKIPVLKGHTDQATIMSYGFNPRLSQWSPFHGALYAVIDAVSRVVAGGADYRKVRLSLQEYFEKLRNDPTRWGKPLAALLGAYHALSRLEIAAIGGKDSMSGSFEDLDVPPTLIAFALDVIDSGQAVSSDFKEEECPVLLLKVTRDREEMPSFDRLKANYRCLHERIRQQEVLASGGIDPGGIASTVAKMCFGNRVGFEFTTGISSDELFRPHPGGIILQIPGRVDIGKTFRATDYQLLGSTSLDGTIRKGSETLSLTGLYRHWCRPLEKVFPTDLSFAPDPAIPAFSFSRRSAVRPAVPRARPRVLITAFPGTNCEDDTARAFWACGADPRVLLFRNLDSSMIHDSLKQLETNLNQCQILVIPGGFSLGDEPEGSGKFISTVFRNPGVKEAVLDLLYRRDGLIMGICNGFQALIKLGLLPFGKILDLEEKSPTLTFNTVGRHVSRAVHARVASVLSPWFMHYQVGEILTFPVSHGEGRFVAASRLIDNLAAGGQIATQYCDAGGIVREGNRTNPNGSFMAIEGITSEDGRVMGKMGHMERLGPQLLQNIVGNKDLKIFQAGVDYFK